MNFGEAIEELKEGKSVKRKGWSGYWFYATNPECKQTEDGGYTKGFNFKNGLIVAVLKKQGGCAPAQPYQADILAEDWEIA